MLSESLKLVLEFFKTVDSCYFEPWVSRICRQFPGRVSVSLLFYPGYLEPVWLAPWSRLFERWEGIRAERRILIAEGATRGS